MEQACEHENPQNSPSCGDSTRVVVIDTSKDTKNTNSLKDSLPDPIKLIANYKDAPLTREPSDLSQTYGLQEEDVPSVILAAARGNVTLLQKCINRGERWVEHSNAADDSLVQKEFSLGSEEMHRPLWEALRGGHVECVRALVQCMSHEELMYQLYEVCGPEGSTGLRALTQAPSEKAALACLDLISPFWTKEIPPIAPFSGSTDRPQTHVQFVNDDHLDEIVRENLDSEPFSGSVSLIPKTCEKSDLDRYYTTIYQQDSKMNWGGHRLNRTPVISALLMGYDELARKLCSAPWGSPFVGDALPLVRLVEAALLANQPEIVEKALNMYESMTQMTDYRSYLMANAFHHRERYGLFSRHQELVWEEIVRTMIKHKCSPNARMWTGDGATALMWCAENDSFSTIEAMLDAALEQGCDLTVRNRAGQNVLFYLIENYGAEDHMPWLESMLKKIPSEVFKGVTTIPLAERTHAYFDGSDFGHHKEELGHTKEFVNQLRDADEAKNVHEMQKGMYHISHRLSINPKHMFEVRGPFSLPGDTVLHFSVRRNAPEITRALLKYGCDPAARNGSGCTAFCLASHLGLEKLYGPLLDEYRELCEACPLPRPKSSFAWLPSITDYMLPTPFYHSLYDD